MDRSAILPNGSTFDFWERECAYDRELIVDGASPQAGDNNDGSAESPLKTISRAAQLATPGTRVRIHASLYRECVSPARGGEGPERMIAYEAFGDGPVVIRPSEQVREFTPSTGWQLQRPGQARDVSGVRVWQYALDPEMFKGYNSFCAVNMLHDRLFIEYDKTDMTPYLNRRGCVFCDGRPLQGTSKN